MRAHDLTRFRAVGVSLDWAAVARPMTRQDRWPERLPERRLAELKERGADLRLAWGCSNDLGVPREAFTVWWRGLRDRELRDVEFATFRIFGHQVLVWGGEEAAHVRVQVDVSDPNQPVGLFLLRTGLDPDAALAAEVVDPGGAASVVLRASCGGATHAVLVNGRPTSVAVQTVSDVVDADDWEPFERVGLPVDGEPADYAPDDQGMVDDPTSPPKAALQRLERVGPPLGWYPVTESGRLAPPWAAPDPEGLVKEAREFLLPELRDLYGVDERDQHLLEDTRDVDPPSRPEDGKAVDQPATATLAPLAMLLMPAFSDPSTHLVTGFGTGYRRTDLPDHPAEIEFMVTARYRASVLGDDVEVAAYVPPVQPHAAVGPVVDLRAERAALLPPSRPDGPFRESLQASWRAGARVATLTGPVAHAFAGWLDGAGEAEDLLPERPGGGHQPRAIPHPEDTTLAGADRPKVVDASRELPVDGTITRGYAVAQTDVFGVWSRWEDVQLTTAAPSVAPPRLTRLALQATYVGTATCPAELTVEFAVDRSQRTAATVQAYAVLYPMPTGTTPPPAGLVPDDPATVPGGCHVVASTVTFTGDSGTASVGKVFPLRDDGTLTTIWGAPDQGRESRLYRLELPTPDLDFGPRSRWGAQVWVRQSAPGIAAPSTWSPAPEHPATTVVASPVPAVPVPPPLPPGVPLGSTPDAQGQSHVRVTWTGLGAHVDRVVVWETSETTLRHRLAPGSPADRTLLLGVRLEQLWALYDAASPDARRSAFRRAAEVPAGPGAADLALPRGSEDIHLFLVTAVTTTGLESPWPAGPGDPHTHLQAAAAPRLRRPAMPLVRPAVAPTGEVSVQMEAASPITVSRFEVFATRSEAAARDHLTMGPRFAEQAAAVAFDPVTAAPRHDPITDHQVWGASWGGALPPSWEPWHLRVVAVPVPTVDVAAERGLVSPASDVVTLSVLPPGPPGLEDLVAEVVGADHAGILVRTATTAPDRPVPAGSHLVAASLDGAESTPVPLESTALVADAAIAPDATAGPVVQRLPRANGRTPLLVWLRRPDPAAEVEVGVRITDPLGRVAHETVLVPGWVPPVPELTLDIVDVFRVLGRGWVLTLRTSADPTTLPPHVLTVVATLGGPVREPFPRRPLRRSMRGSWSLPDIPARRSPVPARGPGMTAVRSKVPGGTEVAVWIPSTDLSALGVTIVHPTQGQVRQTWRR